MSNLDIYVIGLIPMLSTAIGGTVAYFYVKSKLKSAVSVIIPIAIDEIRTFLNTAEGQKMIYSIGLLVGNGAKQGLGLAPAGKGEKGLMGLVSQFLPALFNKQGQSSPAPATDTTSQKW